MTRSKQTKPLFYPLFRCDHSSFLGSARFSSSSSVTSTYVLDFLNSKNGAHRARAAKFDDWFISYESSIIVRPLLVSSHLSFVLRTAHVAFSTGPETGDQSRARIAMINEFAKLLTLFLSFYHTRQVWKQLLEIAGEYQYPPSVGLVKLKGFTQKWIRQQPTATTYLTSTTHHRHCCCQKNWKEETTIINLFNETIIILFRAFLRLYSIWQYLEV